MGRKVRERDLATRESRKSLPVQTEPYWRNEGEGQHIGYYKAARIPKWVVRYRIPGSDSGYQKATLGEADDLPSRPSDGVRVLDWKQAKAKAILWFQSMDAVGGIRIGPYTVADALAYYMIGFTGMDRVNTQRRIDVLIAPALGRYDVAKLTATTIAQWHRNRADTPARLRTGAKATVQNQRPLDSDEARRRRRCTANRDLTVLKAALTVAYRDGKAASDDAWRKVKPFPNVERAKLRYLNDDEARRIVNACDPAFRPMMQAALLTGARYLELAGAKVNDLNLSVGTLWLTETKAGRPRVCYLEDEGQGLFRDAMMGKSGTDWLFPRPDGGRWTASQQARPLRAACAAAKIAPAASFHDLRRTYGARLAVQGVPMAVIAEALGHADERITRRHYAHLSPSYVADTVRAHAGGLGIFAPDKKLAALRP